MSGLFARGAAGVEDVADGVADDVEGEDGEENEEAGGEHEGAFDDVADVLGFFEHVAPAGVGGLDAEAEETQAGFGEDVAGDAEGNGDEDEAGELGEDVAGNDGEGAEANGLAGFDEFVFLDGENHAANDSGETSPTHEGENQGDHGKAGGAGESGGEDDGKADQEIEAGDGHHDFGKAHHDVIDPATEVARDAAIDHAEGEDDE